MFLLGATEAVSPLFAVLTLVLVMAVLLSLLLLKFRQSLLVGYLLAGVLIGNSGLLGLAGMERDSPVMTTLAEIGVVLLMFTLGVGFSLAELRHLWRLAIIGGGLQMGITALIAGLLAALLGFPPAQCAVLGLAVAMSSTAVAMKCFEDIGQPNNPGARASLGVALFQDILIVLVFVLMPAFYEGNGGMVEQLGTAVLKGLGFLAGAALLGRFGVTPLMHAVAETKSRELFTLTVVSLCAGVAYLGGAMGLSIALGAFAAGLVVSESIYNHRILTDIMPFKDLFLAIFFVSVGLMIDLAVVADDWWRVLGLSAAILLVKSLVVVIVLRRMRLPGRPALLAAASLASTGEFSLVLFSKASGYQAFAPKVEQVLWVCTLVTMAAVPVLMKRSHTIAKRLEEWGWLAAKRPLSGDLTATRAIKEMSDHAVICGYGPVGRCLNAALKQCGVDTLVLELNSETVRALKKEGQRVLFADATHPEALDLAGIGRARLVAFTFPAVAMTRVAVPLVRERNSGIVIFGRAKFPNEMRELRAMDVEVIHDERESAVAMVKAAMASYSRADINPEDVVNDVMDE
ncbi:MAG: cation:proton antiporter [Verrucomicrobiota bacterium]